MISDRKAKKNVGCIVGVFRFVERNAQLPILEKRQSDLLDVCTVIRRALSSSSGILWYIVADGCRLLNNMTTVGSQNTIQTVVFQSDLGLI